MRNVGTARFGTRNLTDAATIGGFAITNLFDSKKEYKSGYNIDRRKISAEIKVRF